MTTLKIAVVGLGKMGLSHFSMVNAHPDVETIACDGAGFLVDVLGKNIDTPIYKDFDEMLNKQPLDGVMIATPSRLHASMVEAALNKDVALLDQPYAKDDKQSVSQFIGSASIAGFAQVEIG